jgi:DNA modification methylase
VTVLQFQLGDAIETLQELPDNSVAAIVTDPPYGAEFDDANGIGDWITGAGFSHMGIAGHRVVPLPTFGGASAFGGANPNCGKCSGQLRGKNRCTCPAPDWRVKGVSMKPRDIPIRVMQEYQRWCVTWLTACHRVLEPGGLIKVFGAARTFHRMSAALRKAGFEIKGLEAWTYKTGFPKNLNIATALATSGHLDEAEKFAGYGTALKPAWEPFVVGCKPAGVDQREYSETETP